MIPEFKESAVEAICRVLADCVTQGSLSGALKQLSIADAGGTPKWERLKLALVARQRTDKCGNQVGALVEFLLDPVRFTTGAVDHGQVRENVNKILAFSGLHVNEAGKLAQVERARTLHEAERRASRLRENLLARRVHGDVLEFCKTELLVDNYFHAVLEATKSVAEKLQRKASSTQDGAELADFAFGGSAPRLALNTLRTETERSEQRGFVNLLKGTFGTFRNPTAHAPKVTWRIEEQDALDLLSLASMLHRRIDAAVIIPWVATAP